MPSPHFIRPKKVLKTLQFPHPQFLNNAFIDPYRGCEYGCLYCYGLKEEIVDDGEGLSPFHVGIKTSCAFSLSEELVSRHSPNLPSKEKSFSIGIGFESEPYQSAEQQYQLMGRALEIFKENSCPVQILTKSELVLRDKKILSELSQQGFAIVSVSLFTLNKKLSKLFEPRIISPQKRLDLIRKLRNENIICGAILMPIFPYLSDSEEELEEMFSALQAYGTLYCVPGVLSLSHPAVKKRIFKVLGEKFPRSLDQYQALYDQLGHPALNYCQRIGKILQSCSEKYHIPTVLPVETIKGKTSLIVKDTL